MYYKIILKQKKHLDFKVFIMIGFWKLSSELVSRDDGFQFGF